ncbi:MAG: hypothetical protein NVSMB19_06850 [Vulcanimicrobiaceae bacterium]
MHVSRTQAHDPRPRAADSWECKHAITENGQAVLGVFAGFGTMAVTAETGLGLIVGAGLTLSAMGDVIAKGDAADHACRTGRYARSADGIDPPHRPR